MPLLSNKQHKKNTKKINLIKKKFPKKTNISI